MVSKFVLGVRDIIRVYFWCQHVHNYNYSGNKTNGVVWPFIMTTSLISIFFHGIYLLIHISLGIIDENSIWVPYTLSCLLSAYVTYTICIKNKGFKYGEAYFFPVEKNTRCNAARTLSFLFTVMCFSTRLGALVVGFIAA